MAGRFSVDTVFRAIDKITAPVSRMQNRIGRFTRDTERRFQKLNRSVGNFTNGLKNSGLALLGAATIASGAFGMMVKTGAQFEQSLVNASAKFPEGIKRGTAAFQQLEDAARKTGATTEFTASQSAEALNFLAMAGFNAEQAITSLPGVVDLATSAQLDLARATDIASDALGMYGLMTKDSTQLATNLQRVNDVLAKTANTANTTVEQLFESMRKAGPTATAAGSNIETVAAIIATMAGAGTKAELAGTATANMFLNLSAPASKAQKVLKRLGVTIEDASGGMRDVPDIIDDLRKGMEGLGKVKKLAILESIFGREGLAGTLVVVENGADALRDYRRQLERAEGSSAKMAATMRDTVQGRLNSLTSAIEGVTISIFTMNNGPLAEAIDNMTTWVRTNEKLIATNVGQWLADIINNFASIVTWMKRIAIGIASLMALNLVLKTFVGIMTAVNLVMALNPIGAMILGVTALVAGFTALVVWIDEVAAGFDALPTIVKAALAPLNLLIKAIKFVKDNVGVISGAARSVGGWFSGSDDSEVDGRTGATTAAPRMVSPQERVARSINETRSIEQSEVTIKDETGRAEVTRGRMGGGLILERSGAF